MVRRVERRWNTMLTRNSITTGSRTDSNIEGLNGSPSDRDDKYPAEDAYQYDAGDDDAEDEYATIYDGDDRGAKMRRYWVIDNPVRRIVEENGGWLSWTRVDLRPHQSAEIRQGSLLSSQSTVCKYKLGRLWTNSRDTAMGCRRFLEDI